GRSRTVIDRHHLWRERRLERDHAIVAEGARHFSGAKTEIAFSGAQAGGTVLVFSGLAVAGACRTFSAVAAQDAKTHIPFAVAKGARCCPVGRRGRLPAQGLKRRPVVRDDLGPGNNCRQLEVLAKRLCLCGGLLVLALFNGQTGQFHGVLRRSGGIGYGLGLVCRDVGAGCRRRAGAACGEQVGEPAENEDGDEVQSAIHVIPRMWPPRPCPWHGKWRDYRAHWGPSWQWKSIDAYSRNRRRLRRSMIP